MAVETTSSDSATPSLITVRSHEPNDCQTSSAWQANKYCSNPCVMTPIIMNKEESDKWYASGATADKEIGHIVNLDPKNQQLIWRDGSVLSFDESVDRLHQRHPDQDRDLLHAHLQGWLEQGDLPDGLTEEEIDRLDMAVSEWAEQIPVVLKMPVD